MEVHVKVAFLIIKDQGYNKVIFILELGDHSIIKVNQQSFLLCLPVHSMNHVGMNVIFICNLQISILHNYSTRVLPILVRGGQPQPFSFKIFLQITYKGVNMLHLIH